MQLPNPLIPGFNPDPSIVRVGQDYYLATSTFEYLPGIPIYHSTNLLNWDLIGHVVTRPGQLQVDGVPTAGGAWAPTIRYHDGLFYLAVTDAMGRGTLVFTATNPAGPWSDGVLTEVPGIDPDLAWDIDGNCYITYSGLILKGEEFGTHKGIQQVKVDLATGKSLSPVKDLWSGSGLMFPEAPHLYQIGDYWYLMIAEGGTERGHGVSIARATSPEGPFESGPNNPFLSARSTERPIQNTGHGDLVQLPDGSWVMVLLGMRTRGMTRAFSSLGRETFATNVTWVDGWPVAEPVHASDLVGTPEFIDDFSGTGLTSDGHGLEWVSVRRFPAQVSTAANGILTIQGEGRDMSHVSPTFVGRRQRRLTGIVVAAVRVFGAGGITIRYDETAHYDLEIQGDKLVARSVLSKLESQIVSDSFSVGSAKHPDGSVHLFFEFVTPEGTFEALQTSDYINLGWIDPAGKKHVVTQFDGRYLSAEVTCSFTGRVIGVYSENGHLEVLSYKEVASA